MGSGFTCSVLVMLWAGHSSHKDSLLPVGWQGGTAPNNKQPFESLKIFHPWISKHQLLDQPRVCKDLFLLLALPLELSRSWAVSRAPANLGHPPGSAWPRESSTSSSALRGRCLTFHQPPLSPLSKQPEAALAHSGCVPGLPKLEADRSGCSPSPALGTESTSQPPSLPNRDTSSTGTQTKMPLMCLSLQTKAQIHL